MPRSKQQSDEAVLEAALPVIFRRGPGEFTLAEVAAAAGLAPATLIQRFGSKRGLMLAAVGHSTTQLSTALETLPTGSGADAVIQLFLASTPGLAEEDALADHLLWLSEDIRDPEMNALTRRHFEVFRKVLAERMPPLPVAPEVAMRLIEAQWHGALMQWAVERQGHLVDYVAESLRAWFALAGHGPGQDER
jgi:AcrR family transcriptional regulator